MKTLFLSTLILLSFSVHSQNIPTDSSVTCVAYWKKGDTRQIFITKTLQKWKKGSVTESGTARYKAILRVLDSTSTGYKMEWTYVKPDGADNAGAGLEDLFFNQKIIYTTDDVGIFDSLANYQQILKLVEASIDLLKKQSVKKPGTDSVMEIVKSVFNSRESIENFLLQEINLLHSPYGTEYLLAKQNYPTALPNIFGGEPLPAILSLYKISHDLKKDQARLAIDQELDQQAGAQLIRDMIKKFTSGEELDEDLPSALIVSDHMEFDMQLSTGWMQRVHMTREVKYGDSRKREVYEIVLK